MLSIRSIVLFGLLAATSSFSMGQTLFLGTAGGGGLPVPVTGVETFLQTGYAAGRDGSVNVAGFYWSKTPCPGAVKIKFFRPLNGQFLFVDQRGPFDATSTQQEVRLDPPVLVHAGDLVAITNVTTCGGPVTATQASLGLPYVPPPLPPYYAIPGDVVTDILPASPVPTSGEAVFVNAVDRGLALLGGRFQATILAVNPRTGLVVSGYPVSLGDRAGYFSFPDLTYDTTFPEVVVKMVDARASPDAGGSFWFFHSPLTDLQYTITVTDTKAFTSRTYSSSSGGPGQLCGAVDTSAFAGSR